MMKHLMDQVYRRLADRLIFSSETISYYDLTHPEADETVRQIFTDLFETIYASEKDRIESKSAGFDYSSNAVQRLLQQLINELKKQRRFTQPQVESIIREALQLKMEYIIRPLGTCEKQLFVSHTARTVEDIAAWIRRFGIYRYYSDALTNYAASKSITHLTQGQLRMLITDINQSLFALSKTDNILKLCGQMINSLNTLTGQDMTALPVDLLIEAFDDRSMTDAKEAMLIEKKLDNNEINLYALRQILNRFQILKEKSISVPEKQTPAGKQPVINEQPAVLEQPQTPSVELSEKTDKTAIHKEDSGELIDINLVIEETTTRTKSVNQTGSQMVASAEEIDREVTGEFIREELAPKFNDDTKTVKILNLKEAEVLVPVETLITAKDEKIFMKKFFNQDEALFRDFIQRINAAKRWKYAMKEIDDLLYRQKADPFCREAVRLSDIVYQRYYPPEENS